MTDTSPYQGLPFTDSYLYGRFSCDFIHTHDDVIKWKHFPGYWTFVRGIHRSAVNSHHKGRWCGALMLSLICTRINGWVNHREAGDLRRHRAHYDVTVIVWKPITDVRWTLRHRTSNSPMNVPIVPIRHTILSCQSGRLSLFRDSLTVKLCSLRDNVN